MKKQIKTVIDYANHTKTTCHFTRGMFCPIGILTQDYYKALVSYANLTRLQ